jgi:DNA-binding CsgD family transcriptional regulator
MENLNVDSLYFSAELTRTAFNALSAHIAILDEKGVILETNEAWQNFADRNGSPVGMDFRGVNYLNVCDMADADSSQDACDVAQGIRAVIDGELDEFLHDYPCHSPESRHWYYMRVIRIPSADPVRVIVSHEDITALKLTEEALNQSREELEEQKQSLEEANIALKVLLRQRENDKSELEQRFLANIKSLVLPYVQKLKNARLKPKEKTMVEIIETHLNDIVSPLLQQFSNANIILTPQEMQVASLVKDGKTSKEIADILNITEATVNFHRKNLRIKFGLKNKQTNLRSYLMSHA